MYFQTKKKKINVTCINKSPVEVKLFWKKHRKSHKMEKIFGQTFTQKNVSRKKYILLIFMILFVNFACTESILHFNADMSMKVYPCVKNLTFILWQFLQQKTGENILPFLTFVVFFQLFVCLKSKENETFHFPNDLVYLKYV